MAEPRAFIPLERIERRILLIRGEKVIVDQDLAALYGVAVKRLNEQVRRNRDRFPADFMFRLTKREHDVLRSHSATLKTGRGEHRKYLPYAFTEHGAIMAATVLNSPRAVAASIAVVRTFVRLRRLLSSNAHLARRLAAIEKKVAVIYPVVLKLLAAPPEPKKKGRIGFVGAGLND